jgi:VWFA-related protein
VRRALILAIVLAFASSTAGQIDQKGGNQKTPTYRLQANLVAIPVYVTDKGGSPVRDLKAEDFEVREGGVPCRIEAVEFIDHAVASGEAYINVPGESRRQFLLLFDLNFTTPGGLGAARRAGLDFLENSVSSGDLLAVATVSGRKGVRMICPFTPDHEQVRSAISSMGRREAVKYREGGGFDMADIEDMIAFGFGEEEPEEHIGAADTSIVDQLKSTDLRRYEGVVLGYFDALGQMVDSMFTRLLEEFRKAGAVVYAVNTQRLQPAYASSVGLSNYSYTLYRFAIETNGNWFINRNDLDAVLDDVSSRTRAGYLVMFQPSRPGKPGESREIKVSVRYPGLRVDYQRGYTFEKDFADLTPQEKQLQLNEFAVKDIISRRIPFEFDVNYFPGDDAYTRVPVVVGLEGGSLVRQELSRKREGIELEIHVFLLSERNEPLDYFADVLEFDTPELLRQFVANGIKYYGLLLAEPGQYKVKCIVRDGELGMISSDEREVEVPDFTGRGLLMSGPVFLEQDKGKRIILNHDSLVAEGRRRGKPADYPFVINGRRWAPAMNPAVGSFARELLFVGIHGFEADPVSKEPQIALAFETIDDAGNSASVADWRVVDRRVEGGGLDLMISLDLLAQDLAPGQYRLRMKLGDKVSGGAAASDTPFSVPGGSESGRTLDMRQEAVQY